MIDLLTGVFNNQSNSCVLFKCFSAMRIAMQATNITTKSAVTAINEVNNELFVCSTGAQLDSSDRVLFLLPAKNEINENSNLYLKYIFVVLNVFYSSSIRKREIEAICN